MKLLDFAKMKKASSDGKTSTFRHDDGHEMKILHSALSKIQQEQIKRIPTHNFDEGGVASADAPSDAPLDIEPVKDSSPSVDHATHITINAASPAPASTTPAASQPEASTTSAPDTTEPARAPASPETVPAAITTAQPETTQVHQPVPEMVAANNQSIAAVKAKTDQEQNAYTQMQKTVQETMGGVNAGVINPNHYAESQSSEQKMGTAIGLALMGFGGIGAVGLDFINKQIQRDVEAQKQTFENKNTILGAYQHMFDNADVASKMALATQNFIVAKKIDNAALQAGTLQRGQQLSQQFQLQGNQALQQAAQIHVNESSGNATPKANSNGVYTPTPMAVPGSAQKLALLRKVNPLNAPVDKIGDAYTVVGNADNVLKNLPGQFQELVDNSTRSGQISRYAGTGPLAAAAGEATGLGHVVSGLASGVSGVMGDVYANLPGGEDTAKQTFAKNEKYDSAKTRLASDILNALHGANVNSETINNIVNKNTPEYNDTSEVVSAKLKTIESFIKTAAYNQLLKDNGMIQ